MCISLKSLTYKKRAPVHAMPCHATATTPWKVALALVIKKRRASYSERVSELCAWIWCTKGTLAKWPARLEDTTSRPTKYIMYNGNCRLVRERRVCWCAVAANERERGSWGCIGERVQINCMTGDKMTYKITSGTALRALSVSPDGLQCFCCL